jgi:hypothetical protein
MDFYSLWFPSQDSVQDRSAWKKEDMSYASLWFSLSKTLTQVMEDEGGGRGEGTHVCHRLFLGLPPFPVRKQAILNNFNKLPKSAFKIYRKTKGDRWVSSDFI